MARKKKVTQEVSEDSNEEVQPEVKQPEPKGKRLQPLRLEIKREDGTVIVVETFEVK